MRRVGVCLALQGCLLELPAPVRVDTSDATDSDSGEDTTVGTANASDSSSDTTNLDTSASPTDLDSGDHGGDGAPPEASVTDGDVESDTGGSNTGAADAQPECSVGETLCGNVCVPVGECECGVICELDNATAECLAGECVITACDADFVDCDGVAANGCETSFAPVPPVDQPIPVPNLPFQMSVEEISQQDWEGIPRFSINTICSECERNSRPPRVPAIQPASNRDILPGPDDFRATAALAWNAAGIWLNLVIHDDVFIGASDRTWSDDEAVDARWLDNVMVVWDNESGQSSAGSGSDRVLFAGIDETLNDWREQSLDGVTLAVEPQAQCRVMNLRLSGDYLVDSGGSSPIVFQAGNQHGLTFGYNDFDPDPTDADAVTRQSLVFGLPMDVSPGDYFEGDRTLPQIELVD